MSSDDTPEDGDISEEEPDVHPPRKGAEVDEEEDESFPASDPPSSWAGPTSNSDD
ncbi:MAG TPA: hypothetical protein VG346_10940 [Acidimicrobiales bacterium]|nr:hypothetical protein [Acidimicrobiales bacterium]